MTCNWIAFVFVAYNFIQVDKDFYEKERNYQRTS